MGTVLIFAEPSTIAPLRSACENHGHHPVFISEREGHCTSDQEVLNLWRDTKEVSSEIRERYGDPVGLINCIEGYVELAESLSQELRLPTANGDAGRILRSKAAMKECWAKHGIGTPSVLFSGSGPVPGISVDAFPLVVKPIFGAASAAVSVVDDINELQEARRSALRFNMSVLSKEGHDHSGLIIEEYIEGPEYCVDQIWVNGEPIAQGVLSKGVPHRCDLMDRLYMADPSLSEETVRDLLDAATAAIRAIEVRNGATHTEIRMSKLTGKPYVIEAALRPGASCGLYPTYERAYGISMFSALVRACTGQAAVEPSQTFRKAFDRHYWYNAPYTASGRITELGVPDGFYERHPYVDRVIWRRRIGDYLPREGTTYGYLAWLEGVMPSMHDPSAEVRNAAEELIVGVSDA